MAEHQRDGRVVDGVRSNGLTPWRIGIDDWTLRTAAAGGRPAPLVNAASRVVEVRMERAVVDARYDRRLGARPSNRFLYRGLSCFEDAAVLQRAHFVTCGHWILSSFETHTPRAAIGLAQLTQIVR